MVSVFPKYHPLASGILWQERIEKALQYACVEDLPADACFVLTQVREWFELSGYFLEKFEG